MINRITLFVLLILLSINVFSDNITDAAGKGSLKGFIFDANANQPLEYATIALVRKNDDKVVHGTITDVSGFFKIKDIDYGKYKIEITFIGYKTKLLQEVAIKPNDQNIDLGQISLEPSVETLDEVVVVSDRPTITYKIDKKIINVSQQHTSASGTAIDILENYSSVTVDIDGSVSLRGSKSFTVLIDNKPSVLDPGDALNQIPSNTIENIEIITNPSAKYDSEGSAGIINIITKKNRLEGFNGMVKLNGGIYNNYGGDVLLNFKKEKVNFFVGANINKRGIEGKLVTESRTIYNDTTSFINSDGEYNRMKGSSSVRSGFDFTFNPRNSMNFQIGIGEWQSGGKSMLNYIEYSQPETFSNTYLSNEKPGRSGVYYNMDLAYTRNFLKKGHKIYSLFYYYRRDFDEEARNELQNEDQNIISGQRSKESGPTNSYRIQIDYSLPVATKDKFEAGYQANILQYEKLSELYQYNTVSGNYDNNIDFLYNAKFDKNVHSIYSTYSGEINKFGYKAGIRAEYTYRKIKVFETGESFKIDRIDYFPSAHLSYGFNENQQLMASYSRRIRRPKDWQLEPFNTRTDAYNIRVGNPGLNPQYINSYEINYLNKFGANTFSIDAYYRMTNDKIERIQTVYDENVYLRSYENVGKDYSLGIELMLGLSLIKWWHIDLMGNFYNYRIEGVLFNQDYSENSFNWNVRFNNTLKFGKSTRVQISGIYNSPSVTAQGDNQGYFMTNFAVKQDFLKNISATLQVQGVFGFLEREKTYEGVDFYIHNYIVPYTPIVSLTLSYKFNNYKYDRRKHKGSGDMDNGESGL